MYIAELSIEVSQRGSNSPAVGWQVAILMSGIPLAYWIDLGFTQMTNQVSWRFPIGLQSGFAFTALAVMSILPDTPRWYYAKGRDQEGDTILSKLHGRPIDDARVQAMRGEILASIKLEREAGNGFRVLDLIWDKSDLQVGRRLRTGFILYSLDNLMGINMMVYFATTIFSNIGLSPFLSQVLAATMNSLWSAVAMVICFNFFFGWGWVGVPWLYPSEISLSNIVI
ncbi:sugar transporter STL1 [Penicillium daleae]|uniref:Sugar transporter STL1 n=1 Tax=Penicillium daleae TaxID=63821 RepID=A0AAD6G7G3_9EURO|nr:sugar transporter STL1 [Penicillium daleae]KAJ5464803.1 sugar transporter STL1 [Penicillium daleae]